MGLLPSSYHLSNRHQYSKHEINGVYLSSDQRTFVISSEARNLVLLKPKRFLVAGTPRNDRTEFLK